MNRPFPAFAALLALLTLAMFAVSSSSRSTTVRHAPHSPNAQLPSRPSSLSNFVWIIPAAADDIADLEQTGECPLATIVCIEAPAFDFSFERSSQVPLMPAKIAVALEVPATSRELPPVDLRSHYDPAYDQIVYGAAPLPAVASETLARSDTEPALSAGDLLLIFHDLGPHARASSPSQAAAAWQKLLQWRPSSVTHAIAAVQAWLRYHAYAWAQDLGLAARHSAAPGEALGWTDYAEFMDCGLGQPAAQATATERVVRFGDWLWRSAALSWDRAAKTFAAGHLEVPSHLFTAAGQP